VPVPQAPKTSPLAGDGDVFVAARTRAAIARGFGNRPGYFVGIDPPIGRGLGKIPRLAIGPRGVRAAFLAPGEALVDAVAVALVGDDEYAAVGGCRRGGHHERAGQKCMDGAHVAPGNEESPLFDKPKGLIMINHGLRRLGPDRGRNPRPQPLTRRHGLLHGTQMNGFLAICGICREIIR
jgi:hypothetical protein